MYQRLLALSVTVCALLLGTADAWADTGAEAVTLGGDPVAVTVGTAPVSAEVAGDPASVAAITEPASVTAATEPASASAASEPASVAAASEPASVSTAAAPGSLAAAGNPEPAAAAAEPAVAAASAAAGDVAGTAEGTAPTGVSNDVDGPNNNDVSLRLASDGSDADQPAANGGDTAPNGRATEQLDSRCQCGAGETAAAVEALAPGSNHVSVRVLSDGDDGDVYQSNQLAPSNNYLSVRLLSDGDDGDVYQSNSDEGSDFSFTNPLATEQVNPVGGVPNAKAAVQRAFVVWATGQLGASNNYGSIRVLSDGDGGNVHQSTAYRGGDGTATNSNETRQTNGPLAATDGIAATGPTLLPSVGNSNWTDQQANALVATGQIAPTNNYTSLRVVSDGDDGDVEQSHANEGGDAHANNENTTQQSNWQAGPAVGLGQLQQAENSNRTAQSTYASTATIQLVPSNNRISARAISDGDGGTVDQSHSNRGGDAYGSNENTTSQSNWQEQGANRVGVRALEAGGAQQAENSNETSQHTDGSTYAVQAGQQDEDVSLRLISDGEDTGATRSQTNGLGDVNGANSNATEQANWQGRTGSGGSGEALAANDDKVTQSNQLSNGCNAEISRCRQSNVASTSQSSWTSGTASNNAEQRQTNQISGRDSTIGERPAQDGDNASDFCNADVADNQCRQKNDAAVTQSAWTGDGGRASNTATQQQTNQISGRDSTLGQNGAGDGDSSAGICNSAVGQNQCRQQNGGTISQDAEAGAGGEARNSAAQQQTNEISGRDSTLGDKAAGGGNNATGVCNAAVAQNQCRQQNDGAVQQRARTGPGGYAGNDAQQSQRNQISGRDGTLGITGAGGDNSAAGACNAAVAESQCRQQNRGAIAQNADGGQGGEAGNTAQQSQSNQISGRDGTLGIAGSGGGNSAAGLCNAAQAQNQCGQENDGAIAQSAAAGESDGAGGGGGGAPKDPWNSAQQSQSNQISGRDGTVGEKGPGEGNNATGVCNSAHSENQCRQQNRGTIDQNAEVAAGGQAWNSAEQRQTNQISGRDSAVGTSGSGDGASAAGVCNSAESRNQCAQQNDGAITQRADAGAGGYASNTAAQSQSNQISGRDSGVGENGPGNGASAAGACNGEAVRDQCSQSNQGSIAQNADGGVAANSSDQRQDNEISGRDSDPEQDGSGQGDVQSNVCNGGTGSTQCGQTNVRAVDQTAEGGSAGSTQTYSQSGGITEHNVGSDDGEGEAGSPPDPNNPPWPTGPPGGNAGSPPGGGSGGPPDPNNPPWPTGPRGGDSGSPQEQSSTLAVREGGDPQLAASPPESTQKPELNATGADVRAVEGGQS